MCGEKYWKLCTVLSYRGVVYFCTFCILRCLLCIVVSCLACIIVVVLCVLLLVVLCVLLLVVLCVLL